LYEPHRVHLVDQGVQAQPRDVAVHKLNVKANL
jgi:hypothetical protein